ncbi:MAG: NGG1p interacting factor NIF3 [Proteobacteria bacterium]|nr:NGG1p interacting factor NIF3 [Pseudomonadota bacterium]
MYKLSFFVPQEALEAVKVALFKVGAGCVGGYDQCCWQVKGLGQFRPLPGSDPAIGDRKKLTTLEEWKVELVCEDGLVNAAVKALKATHPYEEVAYELIKLVDVDALPE